jgi:isoleucyl-tRNA synthetase
VVVVTNTEAVRTAITRLNPVCMDRANARSVPVVMGRWDRIGWHAAPVMKALGPVFGKNAPKVKAAIEKADGNAMKMAIDKGQTFTLHDGDAVYEIGAPQLTFSEKLPADVFSAPMTDATVYVDVALTPDLEAEGYAREVIRRIQEMRRQLDLAVEDFIVVDAAVADARICELVRTSWCEGIMEEVRARKLSLHNTAEPAPAQATYQIVKEWDVEGITMTIGISRAAQ